SNSSIYGGNVEIVSLQQAVTRLGMRLMGEIAIAASLKDNIFAVPGFEEEIDYMWKHSLASSAFAKEISKLRRRNVESAYLSALLHQVGKPVLLNILNSKRLRKKLRIKELNKETILELMELLSQSVGLKLAEKWELPDQIAITIQHWTDFSKAERFKDEVMATCLASQFASFLFQDESKEASDIYEHPVVDELNLYPDDIEGLLQKSEAIEELIKFA
ncbi:MAG: HDOD domain-containing protein, partial [Lentisphaeria bacterium]|nr:HDOD domain-containing protein [Lentisphaeria bacterium]